MVYIVYMPSVVAYSSKDEWWIDSMGGLHGTRILEAPKKTAARLTLTLSFLSVPCPTFSCADTPLPQYTDIKRRELSFLLVKFPSPPSPCRNGTRSMQTMRTRLGLLVSRRTERGEAVEKVTPMGKMKELKKTGASWWSSG